MREIIQKTCVSNNQRLYQPISHFIFIVFSLFFLVWTIVVLKFAIQEMINHYWLSALKSFLFFAIGLSILYAIFGLGRLYGNDKELIFCSFLKSERFNWEDVDKPDYVLISLLNPMFRISRINVRKRKKSIKFFASRVQLEIINRFILEAKSKRGTDPT